MKNIQRQICYKSTPLEEIKSVHFLLVLCPLKQTTEFLNTDLGHQGNYFSPS